MTANRSRQGGSLDDLGLIEVLFYGVPALRSSRQSGVHTPPTDVYETEDQIVVQIEIAGVKQSDFVVSLFDRRLIVSGTRVDSGPLRRAYHQLEVLFGDFRAEVDLPLQVDETGVDAQYSDGFLRIILPKRKPKRIDVDE
ncbi:MAG: Hsp20/alpha crystallin family protein [Anaerolineales bacterium]|nr:Hsp20/alpha crystallin family protein [Anaerolineales bacterium]